MFHANFHGDFFNLAKIACRLCLARAGRVLGGPHRLLAQVTPVALTMSLSAAKLPLSSGSCLGFLSHDGFIAGPSPPDPFKLFLLPGISKEICGSVSRDTVYEVISQSGTTLIISLYVLVRSQGCLAPLNNQISPSNKTKQ